MLSDSPKTGLLYVASRLTSAECTPDLYDRWYNEVHVPHLLDTSAIDAAIRYDPQQEGVKFPFLALYTIRDVAFFQTQEFSNIPLTDDMLPGPSHSCLDIAQFDNRRYRTVGKWHGDEPHEGKCSGEPEGDRVPDAMGRSVRPKDKENGFADVLFGTAPATNMLTVEFDVPSELRDADDQKIRDWYVSSSRSHGASSIRVYKALWALLYQQEKLEGLPAYIALVSHFLPQPAWPVVGTASNWTGFP